MIGDQLYEQLIQVLWRVPIVQNPIGLKGLIATIPNSVNIYPDSKNTLADLEVLINHLIWMRSQEEWFLLTFLDKVMSRVDGMTHQYELAEIRSRIETLKPPAPQVLAPHYAIESYTFDLEQITFRCLGMLPKKPMLVGYTVALNDEHFLRCLCLRIKHTWIWGNAEFHIKLGWTIHPSHTSVQDIVQKICALRHQLQKKIIVVGILVQEIVDAQDLWQCLQQEFTGEQQNYLIVIMALPQSTDEIRGVTLLGEPQFTREDVWNWIGSLTKKLQWPTEGIERWVDVIVTECQIGDTLYPEYIYRYLAYDARDLLEENSTYESFCAALQAL